MMGTFSNDNSQLKCNYINLEVLYETIYLAISAFDIRL